ncbi:MAG TPA: DUF4386 domain-containing protein [Candidatus Eremiobacteraceae bacterium]|nr:DUF4386 domain-containing protein [Candidatus Eremiobacteraceae bacterium]
MDKALGSGLTLRQAALTVGFGYLLNPVPYAEFGIWPKLVVSGNAAQTVANISAHQGLFLVAILCYLINFIEDIVIAWALYFLLAPVNKTISMLAALFRLMYTAIAFSGMFNLVTVARMVQTPAYLTNFGRDQFDAQIDLLLHIFRYDYAYSICAVFSIHLLLVGYLIIRSRYIPWWLGAIVIIDGLAWIVKNLQPFLYPNADLGYISIAFWGELVLMLWLLIFGWKMKEPVAAT